MAIGDVVEHALSEASLLRVAALAVIAVTNREIYQAASHKSKTPILSRALIINRRPRLPLYGHQHVSWSLPFLNDRLMSQEMGFIPSVVVQTTALYAKARRNLDRRLARSIRKFINSRCRDKRTIYLRPDRSIGHILF